MISVNKNLDNVYAAYTEAKVKCLKNLHVLDKKQLLCDGSTLKIVCISDTHSRKISNVPNGDILIHAGDFSTISGFTETVEFNTFMDKLPHKVKIAIAGNHEISLDPKFIGGEFEARFNFHLSKVKKQMLEKGIYDLRELLTSCIYLEDSSVTVSGINIYGSPWTPLFAGWAFNVNRGQKLLDKWNRIPANTDVLVTHGPPLGIGDLVRGGGRAGCSELLSTVLHRIRPRYHVFGHIHEDYGVWQLNGTRFINASTCDRSYQPVHEPIVFNIPVDARFCDPAGVPIVEDMQTLRANLRPGLDASAIPTVDVDLSSAHFEAYGEVHCDCRPMSLKKLFTKR